MAFSEIHYSAHYYPRASFSLFVDELLGPFLCCRLRGRVQIALYFTSVPAVYFFLPFLPSFLPFLQYEHLAFAAALNRVDTARGRDVCAYTRSVAAAVNINLAGTTRALG